MSPAPDGENRGRGIVARTLMNAAIIGAGIAGLALAKSLSDLGWDVQVYEQAEKLTPVGAGISLTTNALRALIAIGLYEQVVRAGEPIVRLSILDQRGHTLTDTDYARRTVQTLRGFSPASTRR